MNLSFVDRTGTLNDSLREFAERRIYFALSRFTGRIRRVSVVLDDQNGPRGGVDKSCRIAVQMDRLAEVAVADQDAEFGTCLARAAERIGRAVGRAIERDQRWSRSSSVAGGDLAES